MFGIAAISLDFITNLFSGYRYMIIPTALIAIVFHEMCHGYVSYRLGDPTARSQGRLSVNPLRHIDPIGLLMLIFFGFGWAKPVHVDMRYFKNPKRDMALTSIAGPLSNFLLGSLSLFFLGLVFTLSKDPTDGATIYFVYFLLYLAIINIGLGAFNLIPIPPLDGSKVAGAFMPDRWYYQVLRYERYGMLILVVLLYTGYLNTPLLYIRDFVTRILLYLTTWPFSKDVISTLFSILGV